MQRAGVSNSRTITIDARVRDQTSDEYSPLAQNELPPSPASSTDTPVFVSTTPRSDSPPLTSMSGKYLLLRHTLMGRRFMGSSHAEQRR